MDCESDIVTGVVTSTRSWFLEKKKKDLELADVGEKIGGKVAGLNS
jgi:hypothetical protein